MPEHLLQGWQSVPCTQLFFIPHHPTPLPELTVGAAPQTPKPSGTELPNLTWRKARRGRFAERQAGAGGEEWKEIPGCNAQPVLPGGERLEKRPCPQAAARTPGQLQRQPSCKTRPLLAQDILCQSRAALARSPRRLGCDKHPVSPPSSGTPPSAADSTAGAAPAPPQLQTSATKSSHRSYLKTSNPRAPAAHPDRSESSVISISSSCCSASHFRERRKHKPTPSFPH